MWANLIGYKNPNNMTWFSIVLSTFHYIIRSFCYVFVFRAKIRANEEKEHIKGEKEHIGMIGASSSAKGAVWKFSSEVPKARDPFDQLW